MTQRIIGLTGGIATGKTTVANYLASAHHLPIFDADIYARDAVSLGSPILDAIAGRYGKEILLPDGSLNRPKLGEIIFQNQDERHWLESLIHPYVRDRFLKAIAESTSPILVLVIPLLIEVQMTNLVTEIWVVICSESQQLQRLMERNHLTLEQAQARINSQLSLKEKAAIADVVLDNSSSLESLLKQVDIALNFEL
ncbi:dephospho-CoA kinase [Trichormus variabilis ATCC 29413]|uniref:Dephospho-CoA kinase n=2 Tax=Anabaena variabilis TaxID=264691 RepID=COAE_TRIV2|nr:MULTISPECIES: dephospho-CoA kinase [Nostocaceae]Q3MGH8.1 RecName: Full=Dephospho-CoA kinase; AltName: Full=Dephosphocoenzyme A kinase [Trichormus variabilis ATCC 29413]ABA19908.1 dephospho-CoA kinase [Trichormus variabilis ATCC 29413]MBC1215886.1 dephospho-CoA kinase [Trichormus variabilis ARAD]MBC1255404.1 dephospho-CoA kinase [Trichormus variabilis V5]MBC1266295.1 dephospho-CoA kinase [Trichormus variabilis FSR]MBC1304503.1 dephospho-CoA kinase [Trichormus variabilis N2B]